MTGLAGAVVWAVVPFAPEAPFSLYAGPDQKPITVPGAATIINPARRGGDTEFTFLVPGKARPVLVLSDAYDERIEELIALRLQRFTKLTPAEQNLIRGQKDPSLFHLEPDRFDLPEENAAIIPSVVRVSRSAIDPRSLGRLDTDELRVVHERVARHYGLDLHALVMAEIRRLGAQQRRRSS